MKKYFTFNFKLKIELINLIKHYIHEELKKIKIIFLL